MLTCNGGLVLFLLCCCNGVMPVSDGNMTTSNSYNEWENKKFQEPEPSAQPWSCQNIDALPDEILKCSKGMTLSVLNGFCATVDEQNNILEVGHCLYNFIISNNSVYRDFPKNNSNFMCADLNRTGTLCGKCQDGYYPLAYSYDMKCVQCPNGKSNWWKFVLAAFLPLTIFYVFILFFKVNVVSSRFQGFLFYSQIISWPTMVRVLFLSTYGNQHSEKVGNTAAHSLATFYGIWNLDFFRSMNFGICLGTDTLQTLVLDLIVGAYPLLLMVVSYILIELYDRNFRPLVIVWKPFHTLFGLFWENWDLRTSLIDVFVTAFLLTNVKFQSVSFDLLTPSIVYQRNTTGNWTHSIRLYYDATVPYFGSRHLPYGIVGLIVVLLFAILPVLLLVLYPFRCFQKLLNLFPFRWYILHTFVDSFYGSYKDGTQPGTRDCRWFASLFILSRFSIMLVGAVTKDSIYISYTTMVLAAVALLFITFQPFKQSTSYLTTINALFLLLLAVWYACYLGSMQSLLAAITLPYLFVAVVSAILPLLYISAIVLHWMYGQKKFGTDVITKLRAWKSGYMRLP